MIQRGSILRRVRFGLASWRLQVRSNSRLRRLQVSSDFKWNFKTETRSSSCFWDPRDKRRPEIENQFFAGWPANRLATLRNPNVDYSQIIWVRFYQTPFGNSNVLWFSLKLRPSMEQSLLRKSLWPTKLQKAKWFPQEISKYIKRFEILVNHLSFEF